MDTRSLQPCKSTPIDSTLPIIITQPSGWSRCFPGNPEQLLRECPQIHNLRLAWCAHTPTLSLVPQWPPWVQLNPPARHPQPHGHHPSSRISRGRAAPSTASVSRAPCFPQASSSAITGLFANLLPLLKPLIFYLILILLMIKSHIRQSVACFYCQRKTRAGYHDENRFYSGVRWEKKGVSTEAVPQKHMGIHSPGAAGAGKLLRGTIRDVGGGGNLGTGPSSVLAAGRHGTLTCGRRHPIRQADGASPARPT